MGCADRILAESVRKGKAVDSQPGAVREKARAPRPRVWGTCVINVTLALSPDSPFLPDSRRIGAVVPAPEIPCAIPKAE